MHDLDSRREQNPSAACANRSAEIDVLRIHEVALIEQAHGCGVGAPSEQAGAAHPVWVLLLMRERIDASREVRLAARIAQHEPFLAQLVEGADHLTEGQLGAAI